MTSTLEAGDQVLAVARGMRELAAIDAAQIWLGIIEDQPGL
ncbi:hypothetical protein [Candidatus Mycolicibacterium alkanivorans]|nr:hypothetical protein [Candidatus Mycolicibacterium alkanivorans]